jgi:hypothetical protein
MSIQKKYSLEELKSLLEAFLETHPFVHEDEWYAPVKNLEYDGAKSFLSYVEYGDYNEHEE